MPGRGLQSDGLLDSLIPHASEWYRIPDLDLKSEQLPGEVLPEFYGKTATTILVDRKLQVLLLFLTLKAFHLYGIESDFFPASSVFVYYYLCTVSVVLMAM